MLGGSGPGQLAAALQGAESAKTFGTSTPTGDKVSGRRFSGFWPNQRYLEAYGGFEANVLGENHPVRSLLSTFGARQVSFDMGAYVFRLPVPTVAGGLGGNDVSFIMTTISNCLGCQAPAGSDHGV